MTGGQGPHPGQDVPEAAVAAAARAMEIEDAQNCGYGYDFGAGDPKTLDLARIILTAAAPHMAGHVVGAHDVAGKVVVLRMPPTHTAAEFQRAAEFLRADAGAVLVVGTTDGTELDLTVLEEAEMARHGWIRAREEASGG